MNEKIAVLRTSPNSCEPTRGTTVRSRPTIPPTEALTRIKRANCPRFSFRPSRTEGVATEGVYASGEGGALQFSCLVGRIRTSLTLTRSGWVAA